MIIDVYFILLGISLFCIVAGKYVDSPPLQLGGYTFLFLLGITLMFGAVTYKTGSITILTSNSTIINATNVYTNYSGEITGGLLVHHVFGFFMSILSAFGFISGILGLKADDDFVSKNNGGG